MRQTYRRLAVIAKALRRIASSAALLLLAACGGGFHYEKSSAERYPATRDVAWLTGAPGRPHTIIARFRGAETALCPRSQPYCSLYKEAMSHGADAIWVRHRNLTTRPAQWIDIQGRLTRIPEATYERIEGVLIRYK